MKICFISGAFKPGSCGVSDYIDILNREILKNGHCFENYPIESLSDSNNPPYDLPDADIYSVQFSPYAFSSHGLSGNLLNKLGLALRGKKVHVNFHEIWIGAYPRPSWKESIIGSFQKSRISKFLRVSRPILINASNSAAIHRLRAEKINAKYLYLFGNIPFNHEAKTTFSKNTLKIAFFGTLYDSFPYSLLEKKLLQIARLSNKKIELLVIGRRRNSSSYSVLEKAAHRNNFNISKTGALDPKAISLELQNSSFGISTTPFDVLGKSGATAAMLEHGLQVLAYDDHDTPEESLFLFKPFDGKVTLLNDPECHLSIIDAIQHPRKNFFNGVAHVTDRMLSLKN